MANTFTTYGDNVPEVVGAIALPCGFTIEIDSRVPADELLEIFASEMFPSRGRLKKGEKFGGVHEGSYYESVVTDRKVSIAAYNQSVANHIADIFSDYIAFFEFF